MTKTVKAVLALEVEVESGSAQDVVAELTEVLDGYQPVGGNLEFRVSEVQTLRIAGT